MPNIFLFNAYFYTKKRFWHSLNVSENVFWHWFCISPIVTRNKSSNF
jgi:hypothetical protein